MDYTLHKGSMDEIFYTGNIKDSVAENYRQKFQDSLQKDEMIAYYRIYITNPTDMEGSFSCIWFCDVGLKKGYYPVLHTGVNNSSGLAMCIANQMENTDESVSLDEIQTEFLPDDEMFSEVKLLISQSKDNECEICGAIDNAEVGLATGANGVEKTVCKHCDIDGSDYNGWGDVKDNKCNENNRCEECTYCQRTRPCECGECDVIGGTCEKQLKLYENK